MDASDCFNWTPREAIAALCELDERLELGPRPHPDWSNITFCPRISRITASICSAGISDWLAFMVTNCDRCPRRCNNAN